MPDNVLVTPGSGANVATDERTIGAVSVHVQRTERHGSPNITVGQVAISNTSAAIVAANNIRQSVIIVNRQTVAVWINDAAAATTTGFRLDPGDSIEMYTGAVINGITAGSYTPAGVDDKVHYIEVHD